MSTDLTFITNQENQTLVDRFTTLIRDTRFFDCLVGYFYTSGFSILHPVLENTEKIRILIGISTDKPTLELLQESRKPVQTTLSFSHKEIKDEFSDNVTRELEHSDDSSTVEAGIHKFIEWLRSGKLQIKAYPTERIHAKLYIMTFQEGDRDIGRVITGSSNFTKAGLRENIEFNVELKNRSDYNFALEKFDELWGNAVDVTEKYIETINERTWLNDSISPYELYLKFLYEYLKEQINIDQDELYNVYLPEGFMDLEYQKDAVRDAKNKLEEYGGVFISDVVGLGKTYISALLAQQLDGRNLVIAPPILLDEDNPGSWTNVFFEFGVRQTKFESIGKLEKIIKSGTEQYRNVFIDESHRFRTETTQMYEKLFEICRGKRVILVSATPLNNTPLDILAQIKLFQNAHKSTLPNPKVRDLEDYFKQLQNRLDGLHRITDREEYLEVVKENAENIRDNVLQYLMVRRTRDSIKKYYSKDLKKQKLNFPDVQEPTAVIYSFDEDLDKIFNKTLDLIINEFTYVRYTPLLYLKVGAASQETPQRNMGRFMKILLLKRLESSFYAFKQSIGRFIYSHNHFINEYEKGNVYTSDKYMHKIFEFSDNDDDEAIERLLEKDKAKKYPSTDFTHDFIQDLKHDLEILKEIQELWRCVDKDPKLDEFIQRLTSDKKLKQNKILVFTESKETANYLEKKLKPLLKNEVLAFSSESGEATRRTIIENFDPRSKSKKEDIRVLLSTEILSEGVNLHRSNVVINYDIPWNPIRMMQRVGRINRVDSKFKKIHTYNFFPAGPINENIGIKEAAEAKINAFIEMLGNDAKLLTDEEIKSHDLFNKLNSKRTLTGEDEEEEHELKYLTYLRDIRDNDKKLFEKIKRLPRKARTARDHGDDADSVVTFFRKGKLRKIYVNDGKEIREIDFFKAAEILEADKKTQPKKIGPVFYEYLEQNKKKFDSVFITDDEELRKSTWGNEARFLKLLKAIERTPEFTEDDEAYIRGVIILLTDGALPKETIKKILKSIEQEINPLKIFGKIKANIPQSYFQKTFVTGAADTSGPREVILSEHLKAMSDG